MTKRPTFLTVLMILTGIIGVYYLLSAIFMFAGATVVERSDSWVPAVGVALSGFAGILFLSVAYGLWQQRTWAIWLLALIIGLNLVSQLTAEDTALFQWTYEADSGGSWTVKITFAMLMEIALIVALLSLRHRTPESR